MCPWRLNRKESSCSARDGRDVDSIPGLGRSPGGGNGNHYSILAWRIPWTEETGGLQSMGSQRVRVGLSWAHTHTNTHTQCISPLGQACFAWSWRLASRSASHTRVSSGTLPSPFTISPRDASSRKRKQVISEVLLRGRQACDCLEEPELSQKGTTSLSAGIPGLGWWCGLTCEGVTARGRRELIWAVLRPLGANTVLCCWGFCHPWGWVTAQGSLAAPFLEPCEVRTGLDGSEGALPCPSRALLLPYSRSPSAALLPVSPLPTRSWHTAPGAGRGVAFKICRPHVLPSFDRARHISPETVSVTHLALTWWA